MWSREISVGCVIMWTAWFGGFTGIAVAWTRDLVHLGHLGLSAIILGACLLVIRDNQRTRRMLRRYNEQRDTGGSGRRNLVRIDEYV